MSSAELADDEIALVEELAMARSQANMWKKRGDEIRDKLLARLDEAGVAQAITASGMPAVHVTTIMTTRVNRKKLEAKYPQVFEDVVEPSETRKLEIDIPVELLDVRSEA